eukprot:scaffold194873_cov42-Prasinocladus_malaysianus.AAC.1
MHDFCAQCLQKDAKGQKGISIGKFVDKSETLQSLDLKSRIIKIPICFEKFDNESELGEVFIPIAAALGCGVVLG